MNTPLRVKDQPTMGCVRLAVLTLVAVCLTTTSAAAQRKSSALVGWIRDSAGAPVVGADITGEKKDMVARTDSTGQFLFRSLEPGTATFRVRRLGYAPQTFEVKLHEDAVDTVDVKMAQSAAMLDAMRANSAMGIQYRRIEEFYQRRARGGGGYFYTREDIEARNTSVLSDVLRVTPGVRITRATRRSTGGLRFGLSSSKAYDCPPQIWLDGRRIRDAEVDDVPAGDVEAVELYAGAARAPVQFSMNDMATCGTIVIWTRIPG